jgi:HprK-related kinase B
MSLASVTAIVSAHGAAEALTHEVHLDLAGTRVAVRCSDPGTAGALAHYFRAHAVPAGAASEFLIDVVQRHPLQLDAEWTDWPREAGKSGLKERYADLPDGRLIWKVRTGMMFLLRPDHAVAVGPCSENLNQVINLVNNQYISRVLAEGWELCHAAGVGLAGAGLGLAGVSGAGKSTLALRLMERGADFVSNDRLLVAGSGTAVRMRGIPKQPRVNPGTLLSLPSLAGVVAADRAAELRALPREELWELEEKYDVDVEEVYGAGRQVAELPMRAFVVLSWSHRDGARCTIEHTTLAARPELLEPIMKHPGPFHHSGGRYDTRGSVGALDPAPYLAVLGDVPLLAVSGGVDFDRALAACLEVLA